MVTKQALRTCAQVLRNHHIELDQEALELAIGEAKDGAFPTDGDGLKEMYTVIRNSDARQGPGAYFVLKLVQGCDTLHVKACHKAARVWADEMLGTHLNQTAQDLIAFLDQYEDHQC